METYGNPKNNEFSRRKTIVFDRHERTEMTTAILENKISTVKKLISNQESLNYIDKQGHTYLHLAAYFNKTELVDLFIKAGLKIDSRDNDWSTPLHSACMVDAINVVQLLIQRGADLQSRNRNWLSPLHICAAFNSNLCLSYFVENVASLNLIDINESTAMHYAASKGHAKSAEILINGGADLTLKDKEGRSCLHYSVTHQDPSVLCLLINCGMNVNEKDNYGLTPLHIACAKSVYDTIYLLIKSGANINEKDNCGNIPFHFFCKTLNQKLDETKILNLLVKSGSVINQPNENLIIPLHSLMNFPPTDATFKILNYYRQNELDLDAKDYLGRTALHIACYKGFESSVSALVDSGCDVRVIDNFNRTVLHYAVEFNHFEIVEYLLKVDPDLIHLKDINECSPLHYSAKSYNSQIWNLLIKYDSDFSQKDTLGRTVHFYLAYSKEILKTLLPLPSFLDSYSRSLIHYALNKMYSPNSLDFLLKNKDAKFDVNQKDMFGRTPLHYSCYFQLDSYTEKLLQNNASFLIEDNHNLTPLHYLIISDNSELIVDYIGFSQLYAYIKKIKVCLLECAAFYGSHNSLKLLIEYGYKPNLTKCLEYATLNGHVKCVEVILCHMFKNKSIKELYKSTALHIAAINSDFKCFNAIMVNLENSDVRDEFGRTVLMFALVNCSSNNFCLVSLIHRKDCDINAEDNEKRNALFYSIYYNNEEAVMLLLDENIDYMKKDLSGKTPLHVACMLGNTNIIEILLSKIKKDNLTYIDLIDNEGYNPLHYACYNGKLEPIKILLESVPDKKIAIQSKKKVNYLHLACYSCNPASIKLIIDNFKPSLINYLDQEGRSPLHYLCISKVNSDLKVEFSTYKEEFYDKNLGIDSFKILMSYSVDINCQDIYGKTPLILCIQNQSSELGSLLIDEKGINLAIADKNGNTALHYACRYKSEIIGQKLICQKLAPINVTNKNGRTPLHIASSNGSFELTKSLLYSGSSCFIQDANGFTPSLACAKNNDVADCLDLIIEVMIFEKTQNETNISTTSNIDRESVRCSSPIIETRRSLILQKNRRSESSVHTCCSFDEDIVKQLKK